VEQLAHGLQAAVQNGLNTPGTQLIRFDQPVRVAAAAVEIGGEVKALHGGDFNA
jgi:hypothetical protein